MCNLTKTSNISARKPRGNCDLIVELNQRWSALNQRWFSVDSENGICSALIQRWSMVNSINYDQRCTALFWKMLKIINADQRWSAMISVDSALKTFLQCRLFKSDIYQCSNNGRKTVPLIKFDHCNDQICSKCQIFVFHENAESTLMQRWWNQRWCNADF